MFMLGRRRVEFDDFLWYELIALHNSVFHSLHSSQQACGNSLLAYDDFEKPESNLSWVRNQAYQLLFF